MKITDLPVQGTVINDDYIIVSNSSDGTRKLKMTNLFYTAQQTFKYGSSDFIVSVNQSTISLYIHILSGDVTVPSPVSSGQLLINTSSFATPKSATRSFVACMIAGRSAHGADLTWTHDGNVSLRIFGIIGAGSSAAAEGDKLSENVWTLTGIS